MHLTPAEYVIHVFGGIRPLARAIGRDPSGISHWKNPKVRNGMDGYIPRIAQQLILQAARKRKLDVTASDLIHGRDVSL